MELRESLKQDDFDHIRFWLKRYSSLALAGKFPKSFLRVMLAYFSLEMIEDLKRKGLPGRPKKLQAYDTDPDKQYAQKTPDAKVTRQLESIEQTWKGTIAEVKLNNDRNVRRLIEMAEVFTLLGDTEAQEKVEAALGTHE